MLATKSNNLWSEDEKLFRTMKNNYISDNEREFFEKQEYKQRFVMTVSNDLVMSEFNNEDHLYIVRCWYDEYIVGCENNEKHFMNLSSALNANLKEIGISDKAQTLLQWLRDRDYKGIEYDHNFDNL